MADIYTSSGSRNGLAHRRGRQGTPLMRPNLLQESASRRSGRALPSSSRVRINKGRAWSSCATQYARESVPQELWSSPRFKSINRRLTAMWGFVFLVMAPSHVAAGAIDTHRAATFFNWADPDRSRGLRGQADSACYGRGCRDARRSGYARGWRKRRPRAGFRARPRFLSRISRDRRGWRDCSFSS